MTLVTAWYNTCHVGLEGGGGKVRVDRWGSVTTRCPHIYHLDRYLRL